MNPDHFFTNKSAIIDAIDRLSMQSRADGPSARCEDYIDKQCALPQSHPGGATSLIIQFGQKESPDKKDIITFSAVSTADPENVVKLCQAFHDDISYTLLEKIGTVITTLARLILETHYHKTALCYWGIAPVIRDTHKVDLDLISGLYKIFKKVASYVKKDHVGKVLVLVNGGNVNVVIESRDKKSPVEHYDYLIVPKA